MSTRPTPTQTNRTALCRTLRRGDRRFRATVDAYAQRLYGMIEATARTPWFLGERFSALDIYVAVMTRWRPRRQWFAENAPQLHSIATRADAVPQLQSVWSRNFPEAAS